MITTLLDAVLYPATELATLYQQRWQIETNLRHLKQTAGMDMRRTETVDGIHKELAMFAIAYNLIRLVMMKSAVTRHIVIWTYPLFFASLAVAGPGNDPGNLAL